MMLATILLLALLAVASVTDFRRHRIYNATTYPGILLAWALNGLGSLAVAAGVLDQPTLQRMGWIGLGPSLGGFLVCAFILLVCFVLFQVGGGDVKLMAMVGAFLGPQPGIIALLWTFVLGACMALAMLIWRVGPLAVAAAVVRHAKWLLRLGRLSALAPEERAACSRRCSWPPAHWPRP